MNGKQAKLLRKSRATKDDIKAWRSLPGKYRGMFRKDFEGSPKMVYQSFAIVWRRMFRRLLGYTKKPSSLWGGGYE